ncbi:MAG: hypothetical protein C4530_08115 [Desulfobacteraceae bacterium]|nr:MAG: hypothetical protein C4530_08115 [Desulfobacteraceae bacterium]
MKRIHKKTKKKYRYHFELSSANCRPTAGIRPAAVNAFRESAGQKVPRAQGTRSTSGMALEGFFIFMLNRIPGHIKRESFRQLFASLPVGPA